MIQTGVNVIWPLRMDPILDPILRVPGPLLGDPNLGRSRARHGEMPQIWAPGRAPRPPIWAPWGPHFEPILRA